MKLFTKLALVSAIAMSGNAMAMQAMDDTALSSTTGQDGISIGIGISKIDIAQVHVFDGDGLKDGYKDVINSPGTPTDPTVYTSGHAGAIEINSIVVSAPMDLAGTALDTTRTLTATDHRFATLDIDTDGGNGHPFLNVAAKVSGLDISLGKINVTTVSGTSGAYVAGTGTTDKAEILSGLSLKTGVLAANIQLGNTPQGAMIKLSGTMAGGLEINNLTLKDATGGGSIYLGGIKLKDSGAGSTGLTTNADIKVTTDGLEITALGTATDIYITNLGLGNYTAPVAASTSPPVTAVAAKNMIGDIAISGMKVYNTNALGVSGAGAVITISGH